MISFLSRSLTGIAGWLFKTPTAEGQTGPTINYDDYFKTIATTTSPSYLDSNVTPSTVYMYRVRLMKGSASTWSNIVAGVTLPANAVPQSNTAPICTAYGYCNYSVKEYLFGTQSSESQCTVNANCTGVGRASTQTHEQ